LHCKITIYEINLVTVFPHLFYGLTVIFKPFTTELQLFNIKKPSLNYDMTVLFSDGIEQNLIKMSVLKLTKG